MPVDSGSSIVASNSGEADLRENIKIVLDAYTNLTQIILAAFGAIAFLVAYREKQAPISTKSWAPLAVPFVVLFGGLILTLLGREALVTMISRNSVELGHPALEFGRRISYVLLLIAAAMTAAFALDTMIMNPRHRKPTIVTEVPARKGESLQ